MSSIYDKIYGSSNNDDKSEVTTKQPGKRRNKKVETEEEANSVIIPVIISVVTLVVALFCLVAFVVAFSYDVCVFLDSYYVYIAAVSGAALVYGMFHSLKCLRKKFSVLCLINLIVTVAVIFIFIVPFIFGLIYF